MRRRTDDAVKHGETAAAVAGNQQTAFAEQADGSGGESGRSGTFEPLRFVPKGKMVVLGLVTSKRGNVLTADEQKAKLALVVQVASDVWA